MTSSSARPPSGPDDKSWWQRMAEASADSDEDEGPDLLSHGEKLESLLHLAAFLPSNYSEDLEFPPFNQRSRTDR